MESSQSAVNTPASRTVHIPEIAGSLKTLFVLRTTLAFGLIFAGIACLYFGGNMLTASLSHETQTILFEISNNMKVTAGGFGAVVMAASLVPFFLAYRTRPTIELIPTSNSGYGIHIGESRSSLPSTLRNAFSKKGAPSTNTGLASNNTEELPHATALSSLDYCAAN
jgi:hypothetical protein